MDITMLALLLIAKPISLQEGKTGDCRQTKTELAAFFYNTKPHGLGQIIANPSSPQWHDNPIGDVFLV